MPLTPDAPFPKSRSDVLRSKDWNDLVNEVRRLDTAKVSLSGDAMSGPLSVSTSLTVGTASPLGGALFEANSGGATTSSVIGVSTPNGEDFVGISGGRRNNQNPHIAWRRGNLRLGTAATFGGQAFSEKLRITEAGNVGIGVDPDEKLHVNGAVRGNGTAGQLRISTEHGHVDIGPRNAEWAHFMTDREKFWFNKEIRVETGQIGSYNENLELRTSGTTRLTVDNGSGFVGIGGAASLPLYVHTPNASWQARFANGTSNVYLSHGGNFGIHINTGGNNDIGRYALEVRNAQGTHLYVRDDGNVGIGTRSPDAPLHVANHMAVGPFSATTGVGGIDLSGPVAELGLVRRNLTSWPASPAAGDRFVWYNPDGSSGRLWTNVRGDLLRVSNEGDVWYRAQLNKLDVDEAFTANVRCGDFRIGHSSRKGSLGRALVDRSTFLVLNYGPDWPQGTRHYGALAQISTRQIKEDIVDVSNREAFEALELLNPVKFHLKADTEKNLNLGFIAEDVPDLVATADREAIIPNHVVAILTRVVKEQQSVIEELREKVGLFEKRFGPAL